VSTDAFASLIANLPEENKSASDSAQDESIADVITQRDELMESIGQMIQDLLIHSDNAKVMAALDRLNLDLHKDDKAEQIQAVGGCFALVYLVNRCLKKVHGRIIHLDQVTKLSKHPELVILFQALHAITNLTLHHDDSKVGISSAGGVEAILKVMLTLPKCEILQAKACHALLSLTCCSLGKKKALEAGAVAILLDVVKHHVRCARICEHMCTIFYRLLMGSKVDTKIFLSSGGVATLTKVREKWPDDEKVQEAVRELTKPIVNELNSWSERLRR
jgi:hypothetical protein